MRLLACLAAALCVLWIAWLVFDAAGCSAQGVQDSLAVPGPNSF